MHENVKSFMQGFRYDAHPMGMLLASVGALSTFYPDATQIKDAEIRYPQMIRLIAKMPTLAAFAYRHTMGQPYVYPDNDLRYPGNFLNMLYKMTELKYQPDPRLERALDILFILHADHEQNCSTNAVRAVGSSQVDPYSAVAAGVAALYGPLHGGANEAVLRMLRRIETKENIPDFIKGVKDGKERLMGFGHRVYKNYDPRAKIIKKATDEVFEVTGTNPLLEIALELEKIALEDDYFVKRKLYPNVDFYSGLIYEALGMPVGMFPVLFAIPRTSGWIAQWLEMIDDKEQKIARPRQIYTGERTRDYVGRRARCWWCSRWPAPSSPVKRHSGPCRTMSGMGTEEQTMSGDGVATASETLTITDNRTGRTYEVPIEDGTIRALALRDIKVDDDDFGLMTYDPAYMNTASCRSAITYIDGDKGILEYRGYPIEQLAEQSTYLEVAYLLVHGELPTQAQLDEWTHEITIHTFVHENVKKFMEGYRYDAHPMGMLCSSVGALSTFYPDASQIKDADIRYSHVIRLIAKMPTLAAFAYRHNMGQPYVYPDNDLRYPGNFLNMLYKMTELKYQPDPRLERALDILFILHADHEQNCSTSAVRSVGSSQVDPYSAVAAGVVRALRPAARRRQRGRAAHAAADREHRQHPRLHAGREGRQGAPDGLRPPGLQELRPARQDHQEGDRRGVRGHGHQPAARHRARAREDRARGRLLRQAQAVPERRLLLGPDLRGARDAGRHVPGPVRDPAHERMDRTVAGDDRRLRAEDRAAAPDLHGRPRARLRADRGSRSKMKPCRYARSGRSSRATRSAWSTGSGS